MEQTSSGNRGLKRAFFGVRELLKSKGCKTQQAMADALDVAQSEIAIWSNGKPPKNWKLLSKHLYNFGYSAAVQRIMGIVIETSRMSQSEIADVLDVYPNQVCDWVSGKRLPREETLKRLLGLDVEGLAAPLIEFAEIKPERQRGRSSWKMHSKGKEEDDLRKKLEDKRGLYVFYDSAGRTVYVGMTKANLWSEAKQRLKAQMKRPFYAPDKRKRVSVGDLACYLSAYEVHNPNAIRRLEALLLRAFPNDHANKNSGKLLQHTRRLHSKS